MLSICCARTFVGRLTGPMSKMGINRETSKKPALWAEEAETGHLNQPLGRERTRGLPGERVRRRARPCEGQSTWPGSGCRAGAPESLCSPGQMASTARRDSPPPTPPPGLGPTAPTVRPCPELLPSELRVWHLHSTFETQHNAAGVLARKPFCVACSSVTGNRFVQPP